MPNSPGKTILVIDDDSVFRTFVREILRDKDYTLWEAANGKEAHERLASFTPDLILLDVMMPDVDGISLCREIRSLPNGGTLPIILISALSDRKTVRDAKAFGATDYLTKPVDVTVLVEAIEKLAPVRRS